MTYAWQGREVESLNGWWHTWLDEGADWRGESLLPADTPARDLPARAPSAGWHGMEWGMESTRVPGTLEQARPGYHGVAWQWRPVAIPEGWAERTVHLAIGGARQRVEVFVDERPVGYDVDGLTPFRVDLTPYVRAGGQHELAVRVTNPGGWRPGGRRGALPWGEARLPGSPDVGGLWGGLALLALPRLRVEDVFPIVRPDGVIAVRVALRNDGAATGASVRVAVTDATGRPAAGPVEVRADLPAGGDVAMVVDLAPLAEATPWAVGHDARLYRLSVEVSGAADSDRTEAPLGLRWVEERDGQLWVNGAPTAPEVFMALDVGDLAAVTDADAQRVVARAEAEGARGLEATVWPASPALLAAADRAGLPVVQTLVGVEDVPGAVERAPAGARDSYLRLVEQRLRRIIQSTRGHPALVAWRLPLPAGAAFAHYARLAREEDPSRPIIPTSA